LDKLLKTLPADRALSLGLVDGRNIWRTDLQGAFNLIEKTLAARSGDVLQIAPSCSFIHTPVDLDAETKLDAELKNWMAFAEQKLVEVATLAAAATNGKKSVEPAFVASHEAIESRDASARIHNCLLQSAWPPFRPRTSREPVRSRCAAESSARRFPCLRFRPRPSAPSRRRRRSARRVPLRKGELSDIGYEAFLESETEKAVRIQEELGIDVLVHGERTQRRGRVFRRAACRICTHPEWLSSVLWLALCKTAGDRRRRITTQADDGQGVVSCAVAERHACRTGNNPAVVVCARRPAAI
jgi:5-methyltetrahydropteroyltriglutamate--homocysteine methyltransferase